MRIKEILNYQPNKDQKENIKAKALKFLAAFLILMVLLTLVSRAADSMTVARVKTGRVKEMALDHTITADGKISTNKEAAISVVDGIKVKEVSVIVGDRVKKGDVLFTLDKTDLKEQLLKVQQDYEKLKLTQSDSETNKSIAEQKKQETINDAYEDYNMSVSKANTAVSRAYEDLQKAKQALSDYDSQKGSGGSGSVGTGGSGSAGNDTVKEQLEKTVTEKEKNYKDKQEALKLATDEIHTLVEKLDGFQYDDANYTSTAGSLAPAEEQLYYNQTLHDMCLLEAQNPDELFDPNDPDLVAPLRSELYDKLLLLYLGEDMENPKGRDPYTANYLKAVQDFEDATVAKAEAEAALEAYNSDGGSGSTGGDTSGDLDLSAGSGIDSERESLLDAITSAQRSYDDAVTAAGDEQVTSGRAIDNAQQPDNVDSVTEYTQKTDLELKEIEWNKLKKLQDAKGRVKASTDGIITKVSVTTGDKTPDGTAVLMGDLTSGYVFQAEITKEEAKGLTEGAAVSLELGGQAAAASEDSDTGEEPGILSLNISMLNASVEDVSQYEVFVQIPADTQNVGTSATMTIDNQTEAQPAVLPTTAVRESDGENYVLRLAKNSGVLGESYIAEKVEVTILDQTDEYVSVSGELSATDEIILSANKTINPGDRVRQEEA